MSAKHAANYYRILWMCCIVCMTLHAHLCRIDWPGSRPIDAACVGAGKPPWAGKHLLNSDLVIFWSPVKSIPFKEAVKDSSQRSCNLWGAALNISISSHDIVYGAIMSNISLRLPWSTRFLASGMSGPYKAKQTWNISHYYSFLHNVLFYSITLLLVLNYLFHQYTGY